MRESNATRALTLRREQAPQQALDAPVYIVDPPEYATFGGVWDLLWRNKARLTLCSLGAAAIALAIAYSQPKIYEARTSVEIQMPNDDFMGRRQLNPTVEPGMLLLEPFLLLQTKLVESDTMVQGVIQKLDLRKNPAFARQPKFTDRIFAWASPILPASLVRQAPVEPLSDQELLEAVREGLTVRLAGQTQLMEILYESTDPELSSAFANEIARQYIAVASERMVTATSKTSTLLQSQIGELSSELRNAEGRLESFVNSHDWVMPGGSGQESISETRLRQIQSALGAAQEARVTAEARYEMVRNANEEQLSRELDSDTLKSYRVRLAELRAQLAQDSQVLKPAHYKIRQTQAEIEQLQQAFERERSGILARLKSEYESALFREKALNAAYREQSGLVAAQTGLGLRYNSLKHDVDTSRQLYDSVLQKVREADVASAMSASNVHVIDPAYAPEDPIRPNKKLFAAGGFGGGFAFALAWIFLADRKQRQARIPMPQLGAIPPYSAGNFGSRRLKGVSIGTHSTEYEPEFTTWRDGNSQTAQSFRQVLEELLDFPSRHGSASRIITVTSARPREGRTMVCCNLATALAATGKRVLLVDADGLRPRLHQIFNVPNETGLSDLILQHISQQPLDLESAVWVTYVPGLCVLPAGNHPELLEELALETGTHRFFQLLRDDFDVVIVDTPPVLDGQGATRFGLLADGVAMVVRTDATTPEVVEQAVRQLATAGVHFVGAISNHSFTEAEPAGARS